MTEHFVTDEQKKMEKELRELVDMKADLLVFGEREVSSALENFSLRKIYVLVPLKILTQ